MKVLLSCVCLKRTCSSICLFRLNSLFKKNIYLKNGLFTTKKQEKKKKNEDPTVDNGGSCSWPVGSVSHPDLQDCSDDAAPALLDLFKHKQHSIVEFIHFSTFCPNVNQPEKFLPQSSHIQHSSGCSILTWFSNAFRSGLVYSHPVTLHTYTLRMTWSVNACALNTYKCFFLKRKYVNTYTNPPLGFSLCTSFLCLL